MADLVHCYNKGCGQKFDPTNNQEGKKKYRNRTWKKDEGGGGGSYDSGHGVRVVEWSFVEFRMKWHKL